MYPADIDDDGADEDLERDGGQQQRHDETVEAMSRRTDIEEQLQFGDLRQRQDRQQGGFGAHLALLEFGTPR
jgi:hypothetical protein